MKNTKIDVRIAYEPGGKLGADYNRIFNETKHEWVLLLDHDLLLVNPHWYHLCQMAIEQHPQAGLFTCLTNEIGNPEQRAEDCPDRDGSVMAHREFAREVFEAGQYRCTPINGAKCSGMFLLVRVAAWRAVGGFAGKGIFKEDWNFGTRLKRAGLPVLRMDGLYVYHIRDRRVGSWIDGLETTKEIRDRERQPKL